MIYGIVVFVLFIGAFWVCDVFVDPFIVRIVRRKM